MCHLLHSVICQGEKNVDCHSVIRLASLRDFPGKVVFPPVTLCICVLCDSIYMKFLEKDKTKETESRSVAARDWGWDRGPMADRGEETQLMEAL